MVYMIAIDIISKIYYNIFISLSGGIKKMNYYEKIFALADTLAHQEPQNGFEEFYLDKVSRMNELVNEARLISEYESSDDSYSSKMQKLFEEAEKLV